MFAASPMAISSASDDSSSTSSTQRMEVADRRSYLQELPREVLRVQADELDVPQDATVAQMVTAILQAQDIEHDRAPHLRKGGPAAGATEGEIAALTIQSTYEWLKSSPTCPVCKTSILMGIYEGTMPSGSGDSDRPRHRRMRWSSRD
ncbi:hypothetical protein Pmar_PMAR006983 [Perkinsus marinus ATCC 50983]|uniref:Uncharacterized protein n=1 Tax=Perkinsus marinus (strain ATCC 50983 / TXsc) TaxID=423536 RepID=C5KJZ3_PERM5|nr:hypothetical protein Pmar_PMAR006983 [Perkinsus marinus ATCC 50983]EER15251.1 hypothetical protein Pmar_PMAR006983 [Perkinsus marinus ATCC 50983]|eukprot:XP_002783455.1 hypothetical protein Pmar_PMAR006983 [Perkinsus marinus ATCC 50983]